MSDWVFYRAKFFECEQYALDFQRGKLFMNTARFFAELEDTGDGRTDPCEGLGMSYPPKSFNVRLGNIEIPREDVLDLKIRREKVLEDNVLCIYEARASHIGLGNDPGGEPLPLDMYDEVLAGILPSQATSEMGEWCVVIGGVGLHQQLHKEIKARNLELRAGSVEYYDPSTTRRVFPKDEELFYKPNTFEAQREYRFVVSGVPDAERTKSGALILEVGDLSHCTHVLRTSEFLEQLSIERSLT